MPRTPGALTGNATPACCSLSSAKKTGSHFLDHGVSILALPFHPDDKTVTQLKEGASRIVWRGRAVASYRHMHCQNCDEQTVAVKVKKSLLRRALGFIDAAAILRTLLGWIDRRHEGLVCTQCRKLPISGVRQNVALLGWLFFTGMSLIAFHYYLTGSSSKDLHEQTTTRFPLGQLIFFTLGQLILVAGITNRRRFAKAQKAVKPFDVGDECFFCRTPLLLRAGGLVCPQCEIKVEK